ncbi:hypothetical protein [Nocardia wallacei]|uniref:hypothetical protein n=1 Tax=Nocardia wallacei TaxID=480035 RepID=UPI0024584E5E|nr:hypothetical protein [Nocardia wallacei]
MNGNAIEGPQLCTADIIGGAQQRNDVALLAERYGVPLRYTLHIDSHIQQSYFFIEAYDPVGRQRNQLWAIPQAAYTFDGPEHADTDPHTMVITSPYTRDEHRKAASWQKIMDKLTGYAEYLLAPRAPAGSCSRCADPSGATPGTTTPPGRSRSSSGPTPSR